MDSATPPAAPMPASAQSNPPLSLTRTTVARALGESCWAMAGAAPITLRASMAASAAVKDRRDRICLRANRGQRR